MKKPYYVVRGVCLASALFLALQSRAENALQKGIESSQESVLAEQSAGDAMQMEAITVTATRQKARALDVPQTVNVITRKTIENHNVNNIEELIRHTPGVHVNRISTSANGQFGGEGSGFTIRGVGLNRILTTVDGSRVAEANQMNGNKGGRNFVDMSTIKAVEIQRGPASVLWGADAMGGMVAYRTLDPDDLLQGGKLFGAKASYNYDGLNNGNTENVMFAGKFNQDLSALVSYTHREYHEVNLKTAKADGGRWGICGRIGYGCDDFNPTDAEVNNLMAKMVYRPNQDHQFKLTGEMYASDTDSQNIYNYMQPSTAMGSLKYIANDGRDFRTQEMRRYRLAFEHQWDTHQTWLDNVIWHLSYSPQRRTVKSRNQYIRFGNDYKTSRNNVYDQDFFQGDIQLTSSFDWMNTHHKLTYGFQGDYTKTDYSVTNREFTSGKTTIKKGSAAGAIFANAKTTRADLYLQDEIKLFDDKLTVTPGVRRAHYSLDPESGGGYKAIKGDEPRKMSEDKWLPQIGLLYKFNDIYSAYGRFAKGFKMPTSEQLYTTYDMSSMGITVVPNPNLKPEEVDSYELGLRGEWDKGWFSLGAFYSRYTNFIQGWQYLPESNYSKITYLNIDKVRLWGLEASGEWQFARNWSVNGSIDWQYGKQKGDSDQWTAYDGASPLTAVIGLKWEQPEYGLTTELFGTFARGVTRTSDKEYFKPGGYSVFDGYINWQINKYLKVNAAVTNIFNRRYFDYNAAGQTADAPSASSAYTNPLELYVAPGRVFSVGLQATF